MSEQIEDRKIYKRRKLTGLKGHKPAIYQIGEYPLSAYLNAGLDSLRWIGLCGSLEQMDRGYVEEPLSNGWGFARPYVHKYRSPIYYHKSFMVEKRVKLIGESWFPGCEEEGVAIEAWKVLESEWRQTGLPLMSTPATTGMALLWETLPFGGGFPALPDDLARHVRRISPQHRKQKFGTVAYNPDYLHCYDGRFMYAAQCLKDLFPVGNPRKAGGFKEYQPGFYDVAIQIPRTWSHVGLIPMPDYDRAEKFGTLGWVYPSEPGASFRVWVAEPELTFALKSGWHLLNVYDGWAFDKGRPLDVWAKKLIKMRVTLEAKADHQDSSAGFRAYNFARAAVREILTNTTGRIHKNTVEREAVVSHEEWRALIREWGYAGVTTKEDPYPDGSRLVEYPEPNPSDFMIFMPHWSSTLYSLARVEVLKYALEIPVDQLIEIDGDAIYTSQPQRWIEEVDEGKIGQLRKKES